MTHHAVIRLAAQLRRERTVVKLGITLNNARTHVVCLVPAGRGCMLRCRDAVNQGVPFELCLQVQAGID